MTQRESLDSTLTSTGDMSEKIEAVSDTVGKNVSMLNDVIKNVEDIHNSMNGIRISASEINQAMDASSSDAERLSHMTQIIHNDAKESVGFAKEISRIDDELSTIVNQMFENLKGGKHAVTNEEFQEVIRKAMESHKKWMIGLEKIVTEMRIYPIQTNSHKCAFGHFYNAINIDYAAIIDDWKQIDVIHSGFHSTGDKVINAIKLKDENLAKREYNEALKLSQQMLTLLNKVDNKIENLKREGTNIF